MRTSTVDPVHPIRLGEAQVARYRADGFLPVPGVLDRDGASAMYGEVVDVMERIGGYETSKLRQSSQYLAGGMIDRVVNSARLRELAEQLLGGPASVYLPFTAVKGGGGGQFHFHQDNNYTRFEGPGINLWIALEDMSPDNGCLMVVPRSHLQGTLASENAGEDDNHRKVTFTPEDFVAITMGPGDCLAFTRDTVHGSGPNRSGAVRVAYAVQYFRDDADFIDRVTGQRRSLLRDSPYRHRIGPVPSIEAAGP